MLNLLRRGVRTWVAKTLFGILVISFAIWGIGDVFRFGGSDTVATVGSQKISMERFANSLNREIRAASQSFGQPVGAEMARTLGLPQRTLARLAQEATLDQTMEELHVSAPDSAVSRAITSDPSFKGAGGAFDQQQYRYALAQNGFSVESYEEMTRRSIARRELALAFTDGATAPEGATAALYDYQTELRRFDMIALDESEAGEIPAPGEEDVAAYYEAHKDNFTEPERRSAAYIDFSPEALGAVYEPEEDALRALYERNLPDYRRPERRMIYQIVFDKQDLAQAAADRIAKGEADFDAILAERGETRDDATLGWTEIDTLGDAAGKAAYALDAPGLAGPVDTGFGFALLDVTEIEEAATTPFEEVKDALIAELRLEEGRSRATDALNEFEDRYAAGETMEEIAAALQLTLGKVENIAANGEGGAGLSANPTFLQELFSAEEGEELAPLEISSGDYVVLRLDGVTPEAVRPLADVREEAAARWRDDKTREALSTRAEEIVSRVAKGEKLADIAAELGVEVASEGPKTRVTAWERAPGALVEDLFGADLGGAAFAVDGLSATVGVVTGIEPSPETDQTRAFRASIGQQLNALAADDALSLYIAAKQQEAGVSVNQQAIDSVLTQISGF